MTEMTRPVRFGLFLLAGFVFLAGPGAASEVSEKALALYRQGDGRKAIELLAKRIDAEPGDLDARILKLRIRQALGEREMVRKELAARLESGSGDRADRLLRVLSMPVSAKKTKAFIDLTEAYPDFARAWEERGRYGVESWKPRTALEPLQKAIALDPARAESHLFLGLAWRGLENREEEEKELKRAMEISPDDPGIALEWATTEVSRGDFDGAIRTIEPIVSRLPRDPYAPAILALARLGSGDEAGAAEAKALVLERKPTFFEGLVYQGIRLRSVNQLEEAERVLTIVTRLKPENVEAYMQLGILYRMRKDFDSAIRIYKKAIAVDEEGLNALAWRNLGVSYQDLGDLDQAERHIRKALDVDPDYLLAWVDLARVLGLRGKHSEAIEIWNKVVSMAPYGWEALEARQTLPYLEKGEIPPVPDRTGAYVSPLKGMKPGGGEKK